MADNPIEVCGYPFPANLLQMLASCLVKDAEGNVLGFRVTMTVPDDCTECIPLVDCDYNSVVTTPESLVVLGFGLDSCDKLAIKLVNCDETVCTECDDRQ